MEYVPGGSLRFILSNFIKFKEKLVRSYTKQILEGLKSLHEKSIVHGDMKCANLLIDDLGIVKLSDFGFIKQVFNNTKKMKNICTILKKCEESKDDNFMEQFLPRIGSESYTPPEVVRDSDYQISPSYDIWGLGCVVLEMLTGVEPWIEFHGDSKGILKNLKVTECSPTIPKGISEDCADFLEKCFELSPDKRPTSEELLDHKFLTMTEKEVKESLEASNFISFFSILASQK